MSSSMGGPRNGFRKESFILSVDVGTTSIRCHVYDKQAKIRGSCTTEVGLLPSGVTEHLRSHWRTARLLKICLRLPGLLSCRWSRCIQRWATWRWTRTRSGPGSPLWSGEPSKVQLLPPPVAPSIHHQTEGQAGRDRVAEQARAERSRTSRPLHVGIPAEAAALLAFLNTQCGA